MRAAGLLSSISIILGLVLLVSGCTQKRSTTALKGEAANKAVVHVADTGCPLIVNPYGAIVDMDGSPRGKMHRGLDIKAPKGTPTIAMATGEVISVGRQIGGGRGVAVYHGIDDFGNHVFSTYFHLDTFLVAIGDQVKRGQAIATVGTSGTNMPRSRRSHLHMDVFVTPDGSYEVESDGSIYMYKHTRVNPNKFVITKPETTNVFEAFDSNKIYEDEYGKFNGFTYPLKCS